MNVLFLSLSGFRSISGSGIYPDLLREFTEGGHYVYILSPSEIAADKNTEGVEEYHALILRVFTGRMQNTSMVKKGINTILLEHRFITAIKKHLSAVTFDLVLYPTPPVTFAGVVNYIKKRDHAKTYLMLKDIFPQNAVDLGMLSKSGLKGLIYKYFRHMEKRLYSVSDRIGCMSPANLEFLLSHNQEIPPEKAEICPNSIKVIDLSLTEKERICIRERYGLPIDKTIFVYGGNLSKPQGIPFIIECLKSQIGNPDAYFLIAGRGTEYGKLKAFFEEAEPQNMRLMNWVPKEDYNRIVAACDVGMIFLDHRFTIPNFPSRLIDYMQTKLPVLACTDPNTDIGKVIVDGGFGWWCESDDVRKFIRVVEKVKTFDLKSSGQNGFEYLNRNYSAQKVYKTIIDKLKSDV